MAVGQITIRWLLFAGYLFSFLAIPLSLLFGQGGFYLSVALFFALLFHLGYRGSEKISRKLKTVPLPSTYAPVLGHVLAEQCRRRGIKHPPSLELIPSSALNAATYGFSSGEVRIALTQGLLNSLSREEIAQFLALEVDWIRQKHYINHAWLTQFLGLLDQMMYRQHHERHHRRKMYSFRLVLQKSLLLPLTLFPYLVLGGKLGRSFSPAAPSLALFEALRKIDATSAREPFYVPFSVRHLFLNVPKSGDAMVRLLMSDNETEPRLVDRILANSSLKVEHAL